MMNKMMHALRIPTEMVLRSRFSDEAFVRVSDLPKIIRMNDVEMPLGLKRVIFNPPCHDRSVGRRQQDGCKVRRERSIRPGEGSGHGDCEAYERQYRRIFRGVPQVLPHG